MLCRCRSVPLSKTVTSATTVRPRSSAAFRSISSWLFMAIWLGSFAVPPMRQYMTRRLQSRKAELYEQYRAGSISREKFADIQKKDSEKLARLSSRAEEIKRLLVEQYESRGNLAAGKRTADQIILLKDYDPEIIRNFVERVLVYPSGEIEIDMRTSSGFAFVTAS